MSMANYDKAWIVARLEDMVAQTEWDDAHQLLEQLRELLSEIEAN